MFTPGSSDARNVREAAALGWGILAGKLRVLGEFPSFYILSF